MGALWLEKVEDSGFYGCFCHEQTGEHLRDMTINQGSFRWDFWGELAPNALHSRWISRTDLLKISQQAHELAGCFLPVEGVGWETSPPGQNQGFFKSREEEGGSSASSMPGHLLKMRFPSVKAMTGTASLKN